MFKRIKTEFVKNAKKLSYVTFVAPKYVECNLFVDYAIMEDISKNTLTFLRSKKIFVPQNIAHANAFKKSIIIKLKQYLLYYILNKKNSNFNRFLFEFNLGC